MRWKLVVLPAPFGPISASVSFSCTEKLTSCTARRPPNRLLRPLMTSASAILCVLRRAQDGGHQDQCVNGELDAADRTAEPALQQGRCGLQQHGADHRSPQRADAAYDRYQRGLDRDAEAEGSR